MTESRLDKSPLSQQKGATSSLQYPVRRMRNTAVLVKWIEDHQSNPYPTKAEKQYLAYYSGMNLTQLSTWFANARRRIKKIGMKTWLEGRSTFTVDLFPSPTLQPTRAMTGDTYGYAAAASPYTAGLAGSYTYSTLSYPTQHPSAAIGLQAAQRVQNGPTNVYASDTSSLYQTSISSGSTVNGLYGTSQQRMSQPLIGMSAFNWHTMPAAATPLSLTTTSAGSLQQSRPSSNTGPLHSPLTAYSAEALRTHSGQSLDVADGTYSLQQPSPAEQMLPECASTEPILQGSPKTHYAAQASD